MHRKLIAFQDGVFHHGAEALCEELAKVSVACKIASRDTSSCDEIGGGPEQFAEVSKLEDGRAVSRRWIGIWRGWMALYI